MFPVGLLLDTYNSFLNLLNLIHASSIAFKVNSPKPCSDHTLESANICVGTMLLWEWSPRSSRCYPRTQEPAPIYSPVSLLTLPKCPVLQPSLCRCGSYPPLCFVQAALPLAYSCTPPVSSFSHCLLRETPLTFTGHKLFSCTSIELCTSLIILMKSYSIAY